MRHVLRISRLGVGAFLAAGVALAQKPAETKPSASAAPQAQAAKPAPPAQAAKPAAPGKTVAAPKIEIGQETRDMGTVPKGQVIETDFVIRNSGGSDLIISDARPSCGCTVSSFDKVVKPGAEGKIHTSVDTKSFSGPIPDLPAFTKAGQALLAPLHPLAKGIRLLGLGLHNLCEEAAEPPRQLGLAI